LHIAVWRAKEVGDEQVEMLRALLRAGADPCVRISLQTPTSTVIHSGNKTRTAVNSETREALDAFDLALYLDWPPALQALAEFLTFPDPPATEEMAEFNFTMLPNKMLAFDEPSETRVVQQQVQDNRRTFLRFVGESLRSKEQTELPSEWSPTCVGSSDMLQEAFLSVFDSCNNPAGVLYVAPGKTQISAPLELVRVVFQKVQEAMQLVLAYNASVQVQQQKIKVVRLSSIALGNMLHIDVKTHEIGLAVLWGVHALLTSQSDLKVELMPGASMKRSYELYRIKKYPLGPVVRCPRNLDDQHSYGPVVRCPVAPLHYAALCRHTESVKWLLENTANPNQCDANGRTPLHHLALTKETSPEKGIEDADIRQVVDCLIKANASLLRKDSTNHSPLALAVSKHSFFPQSLSFLLAPCLHGEGSQQCSILSDLSTLSRKSMKAAEELARRLKSDSGGDRHIRLMLDVRHGWEQSVDLLANLFLRAPVAAATVLDLFLVKPIFEKQAQAGLSDAELDKGLAPIVSRMSLGGWLAGYPSMRCTFQPDTLPRKLPGESLSIQWPAWRQQSVDWSVEWHKEFLPGQKRNDHKNVVDVETKVLLVPNVLDLDVFMALAFTPNQHLEIFANLSVQAIISCLWDRLVSRVFWWNILFSIFELVIVIGWGLTPSGSDEDCVEAGALQANDETLSDPPCTNSTRHWPVPWCILMSTLLKELCNMFWALNGVYKKWRGHCKNAERGLGQMEGKEPQMQVHWHSGLHTLWKPWRYLFSSGHIIGLQAKCVLTAGFLWVTSRFEDDKGPLTTNQQGCLALIVLLYWFNLIMSLRLVASRGSMLITATIMTMLSVNMLFVSLMLTVFFGAFLVPLLIVKDQGTLGYNSIFAYRGLMFGDGDGLDNALGLQPDSDEQGHNFKTALGLVGTYSVTVILLNLIIAIFSNEYDKNMELAHLHFQRVRARFCCHALLSLQKMKFPKDVDPEATLSRKRAYQVLVVVSTACSLALMIWMYLSPMYTGFPRNTALTLLLACTRILTPCLHMESPWFPQAEDVSKEGPGCPHYLWILHKADFQEEMNGHRCDDRAPGHGAIEEQAEIVANLSDKVDTLMGTVGELKATLAENTSALRSHSRKQEEILDAVTVLSKTATEKLHMLKRTSNKAPGQ